MKSITLFLAIIFVTIISAYSQVTQLNNTPPGAPGPYLGWDANGGSIALDIKTELSQPINFYTFAGLGSFSNMRMTILGASGFVGIGPNLTTYTPSFNLDVQDQINVNFSGTYPINTLGIGYGIEGRTVLQVPGTMNTFIGVNSGSSWISGYNNTFIGENAGQSITPRLVLVCRASHVG